MKEKNPISLIVVNSTYQLLTALNMKRNILNDQEVDIIITDIASYLEKCKKRLEDIKVFRNVMFVKTKELNFQYARAGDKELSEGFAYSDNILRWTLDLDLPEYATVYFANYDFFTRSLAHRYYNFDCEFIWFEDGFSSYVIDFLNKERALINRNTDGIKIKDKVRKALLYEPRLVMRNDTLANHALPKISKDNKELIEQLNYVFEYKKIKDEYQYIFLEQSFRADNIKCNDMVLIKECERIIGRNKFIVKPHPRNDENLAFQLGFTDKYVNDAPWELFLLNESTDHVTIITVCSNAALTSNIVFNMDINTVMLYELFDGKVLWKEDDVLKRYLNKYYKQFSGENYYVPRTIYELRNILAYLGGKDE